MTQMVSAVVVGVDNWKRYTKPLLDSMRLHNPNISIVCVDNGSNYPDYDGMTMIRTTKVVCYAKALNIGLRACNSSDWYLILNNDILIEKPFKVEDFDPKCLYGFGLHTLHRFKYLVGFAVFIPYGALTNVGYYDEEFKPLWFEDADYSIRAQKAGYKLIALDRKEFGIYHFEDENMDERLSYKTKNMLAYKRNKLYVERKHGL